MGPVADVAARARALLREPASRWRWLALILSTVLWLATLVALAITLPDRVPTHWSGGSGPDEWMSRGGSLLVSVALPVLTAYPLIWLSRLAIVWPDGINVPNKQWWLQTPQRLVRFERLLREDLMLVAALMILLYVGIDLAIGYAAHQPGGRMPGWVFPVVLVAFLVLLALILAPMIVGRRYRPREDVDAG